MRLQFWSVFSEVLLWVICFGLPAYILLWRTKNGKPRYGRRFILSVLCVWGGINLHWRFLGSEVAIALARAEGNVVYDGLKQEVDLLAFGWILGLFGTICVFVLYRLFEFLRNAKPRPIDVGVLRNTDNKPVSQRPSDFAAFSLYARDILLGTSPLDKADQSMGFRMGAFHPASATCSISRSSETTRP